MFETLNTSTTLTSSWRSPERSIFRYLGRFTFVILAITLALTASSVTAQSVVYNAVPATLAPSYPSQPFRLSRRAHSAIMFSSQAQIVC
ncbi:MAG: hypothetical protein IPK01_14265 [Acidobacteria bacterium]|nr:hypothetical protein [Acidobacteriota bacterium]